MADAIIDLRKLKQKTPEKKPAQEKAPEKLMLQAPDPVPELPEHTEEPTPQKTDVVSWNAREYERPARGKHWIFWIGGTALFFVLLGIISHNYFFVAFIALAFFVLLMYEKREPRDISFEVSPDGIRTGSRRFAYNSLTSFWIFDRPDFRELSIATKHTLTPFIRIPLGSADTEQIKQILKKYLPEEEHKDFATDQIARALKL